MNNIDRNITTYKKNYFCRCLQNRRIEVEFLILVENNKNNKILQFLYFVFEEYIPMTAKFESTYENLSRLEIKQY